MKKIIVMILLVWAGGMLFAQNPATQPASSATAGKKVDIRKNVPISFSILEPCDSIPDCVHYKSQILFSLRDVNTFLYSVTFNEIQKDNINRESIDSKELKIVYSPKEYQIGELKFSDFLLPDPGIDDLSRKLDEYEIRIQKAKTEVITGNNRLAELVSQKEALVKFCIVKIEKKYQGSTDTISKRLDMMKLMNDPADSTGLKLLQNNIDTVKSRITKSITLVDGISISRDSLVRYSKNDDLYIKRFSEQLIAYLKAVSKVNEMVEFYRSLLFLLYSNEPFEKIISTKLKLAAKYLGEGSDPSNFIRNCNKDFDSVDTLYYSLLKIYNDMPNKGKLTGSFTKLQNFHNSLDRSKYQELFMQILKTYNAISEINWQVNYQTTRVADQADKLYYDIELMPIKNDYSLANKPVRFNYDFEVKGGVKIDFSAGLFFHYNLMDDQYKFVKVTDSSKRIVKENNAFSFIPNPGVLFNIYRRSPSSLKLALNLGVGTNIEKLYYYAGAGLLIGKSERIGINAGIVGGFVKRLSSGYNDGDIIYQPMDQEPLEVPMQTKDPFKIGFFLGFSYNLTGKNDEKMKSLLPAK